LASRRRTRTATDFRTGLARVYGWSDPDERGLLAFGLPGRLSVYVKMIMSGEAAARPHKLQKLEQMLHRLDKSRRDGKVSPTRLNGVFGLASDDLDSGSRPHS
jgi:hypothetical protein